MSIEYSVSFRVLGFDLHPDDLTQMLGISPDRIWLRGERRHPRATIVHNENGWEVTSQLSASVGLQEQIKHVMSVIAPAQARVRQMPWTKVLSCAVSVYGDDRPTIFIEDDSVQRLGQMGASIDIDIVSYP